MKKIIRIALFLAVIAAVVQVVYQAANRNGAVESTAHAGEPGI